MHINTLLVSSLLSSVSFAAPTVEAREDAVSMMSEAGQWTITNTYRTCSSDLTTCFWSFGIYNGQDTTPCIETITGSPATEANGNATCGIYTVTSGWSGQFGPGNGFTTFSVIDTSSKLIIYPAYTDSSAVNGTVIKPDQSYTPQALPY